MVDCWPVVTMETDDVDALLANLAGSNDPFTRAFRAFLTEVHGIDVTSDPLPEVAMLQDTRFLIRASPSRSWHRLRLTSRPGQDRGGTRSS